MYRLQNDEAQHRCRENTQHLTHVRCQQELDRLADIVVDTAALGNRSNDSREVVICQYHVRDILGHIGSGDSHTDTDIRGFDARRVVNAVSGHGCDIALLFPHVDDAHLVFRLYTRINADMLNFFFKLLVIHLVEHRAGDGMVGII